MPLNIDPVLYVVAGGIALLIALIVSAVFFLLQKGDGTLGYDEQLADLIESDFKPTDTKITLTSRWNSHWHKLFDIQGWERYANSSTLAGRDVLMASIVMTILFSIIFRNPIVGPIATVVVIYLFNVVIKSKANKNAEILNSQLPGFLFAFKANIQANLTPERALLKVIDTMPSPLQDDLIVVRDRIRANSTFKEALIELRNKTSSKDLKFLCVCIIQAADSGANMEDQLNTIKGILDSRRQVTNEITKAVKAVSPALWVSSIAIPGLFVAMYIIDAQAKAFWFVDPLSWAGLGTVGLLYGFGVMITKKLVDNIKNI